MILVVVDEGSSIFDIGIQLDLVASVHHIQTTVLPAFLHLLLRRKGLAIVDAVDVHFVTVLSYVVVVESVRIAMNRAQK